MLEGAPDAYAKECVGVCREITWLELDDHFVTHLVEVPKDGGSRGFELDAHLLKRISNSTTQS